MLKQELYCRVFGVELTPWRDFRVSKLLPKRLWIGHRVVLVISQLHTTLLVIPNEE